LVDSREPREMDYLIRKYGGNPIRTSLAIGDYIIGEYGIERKPLTVFFRQKWAGTLYYQLRDLKSSFEKPIVIFEGAVPHSEVKKRVFFSSLSGLLTTNFIPLRTANKNETALLLVFLEAYNSGKKSVVRPRVRVWNPKETRIDMLRTIRGVGPVQAEKILNRFSLKELAQATEEDLMKVDRMTKQVAKRLIELFQEKSEEVREWKRN